MKQKSIIGIGYSEGGQDIARSILENYNNSSDAIIILVQHFMPNTAFLDPSDFSEKTALTVSFAENGLTIETGNAYICPRGSKVSLRENQLIVEEISIKSQSYLPIDYLFNSIGEEFGQHSTAIILSGDGTDGINGLKTIKEQNGIILIQKPESAFCSNMPLTAINAGFSEIILSPENIVNELIKLTKREPLIESDLTVIEKEEHFLLKIQNEIYRHSGIDFRQYKSNTLYRRIEKRMFINNIDSLGNYFNFIEKNNEEKELLKRDFLIGVTRFFRDREVFKLLEEIIFPRLIKQKSEDEYIRIWIPGCSTGEEAYSIAILLDECIQSAKAKTEYKIFATDVDTNAIYNAGQGYFPLNIASEVSSELLKKYFTKTNDRYQIVKTIRERIVFSAHNLLKDPPFIHMDMISCRNMLIYLQQTAQQNIYSMFQFALNAQGFLLLGNSETLGEMQKHFSIFDLKLKLFQNNSEKKYAPINAIRNENLSRLAYHTPIPAKRKPSNRVKENYEGHFLQYMADNYGPSCIFVDAQFNIHYLKGKARQYLKLAEGLFQQNILQMASPEFAIVIREGVDKSLLLNQPIRFKDVIIEGVSNHYKLDVIFKPVEVKKDEEQFFIIEFDEEKEIESGVIIRNEEIDDTAQARINLLERDLKRSREELHVVIEDLESSNENLQSSNEELMASNEELQSTNEEFQSVNEELYMVNSELQQKNKELIQLNNDINNLLVSSEIGILFLDSNFCIRKFTPVLKDYIAIKNEDIGRPLVSILRDFSEEVRNQFFHDGRKSMDDETTFECEIANSKSRHFIRRISPFITADKKIDGMVVTLIDITNTINYQKQLIVSEERYRHLINSMPNGFTLCEVVYGTEKKLNDYKILEVNDAFAKFFGLNETEIIGKSIQEILSQFGKNWLKRINEVATTGKPITFVDFSTNLNQYFNISIYSPQKDQIATIIYDITLEKRYQKALVASEEKYRTIVDNSLVGVFQVNLDGEILFFNDALVTLFEYESAEEIAKLGINSLFYDLNDKKLITSALLKKGKVTNQQFKIVTKNKLIRTVYISGVLDGTEISGMIIDVTDSVKATEEFRDAKLFNDKIFETSPVAIVAYNEKGDCIKANSVSAKIIGATQKQVLNQNFFSITSWKEAGFIDDAKEVLQNGKTKVRTSFLTTSFGKKMWIESIFSRFYSKNEPHLLLIFTDISERIVAETKQREQHEQLLNLFDGIDEMMYVSDPISHEILYMNSGLKDRLGNTDEYIGKKCYEVLQGQKEQCSFCTNDIIFNKQPGKPYIWESQNQLDKKWYRCADKAIRWIDGRMVRFEIASDITNQRNAREILEESEQRYLLVTEATDQGIWDWDLNTEKTYYSKQWKKQVGYEEDELQNEFSTWEELLHPDDNLRMHEELSAFINGNEKIFNAEFRLLHKDGAYRWIRNKAAAIRDNKGQILRMFGAHTDFTEQKLMESKLETALRRLEIATSSAKIGIWEFNLKTEKLIWDKQMFELYGFEEAKFNSKYSDWAKSIHPDDLKVAEAVFKKTIKENVDYNTSFRVIGVDGKTRFIKAHGKVICDKHNKAVSLIGVNWDITQQKIFESELKIAKDKAEIANIHKNNFLSNMSHEIRTPMNSIIGFADLLQDDNLMPNVKERYLNIINSNSKQLLTLIDDIIDISKIEAGELKIQNSECDVNQMLFELQKIFDNQRIEKNRHNLEIAIKLPEKNIIKSMVTDTCRLRQVFINLVGNAMKFTEKGTIEIGYVLQNNIVEFYVKDSGIGIDSDKLNIIFERFRQSSESTYRKYGGTGLGLAISKGIIELLGGNITVESVLGEGTTFKFSLPCVNCEKVEERRKTTNEEVDKKSVLFNKTILVAEDEAVIYDYIKAVLRTKGVNLIWSKNGEKAIEAYRENPNIDLVIMDLKMPVMDGFDAIKAILEYDRKAIIVAHTAYALYGENERCLNAGCVAVLNKPILPAELIRTISKWLR